MLGWLKQIPVSVTEIPGFADPNFFGQFIRHLSWSAKPSSVPDFIYQMPSLGTQFSLPISHHFTRKFSGVSQHVEKPTICRSEPPAPMGKPHEQTPWANPIGSQRPPHWAPPLALPPRLGAGCAGSSPGKSGDFMGSLW